MFNRRLQILIDEERYRHLAAQARREGVSVATLVRRAIDMLVRPDSSRRARAVRRILNAEPMDVPDDPADLDSWIDEARSGG